MCVLTVLSEDEAVGYTEMSVNVYRRIRCNVTGENYRQK